MNHKTILASVSLVFVLVSGVIYYTYTHREVDLYYSLHKETNNVSQPEEKAIIDKNVITDESALTKDDAVTHEKLIADEVVKDALISTQVTMEEANLAVMVVYLHGSVMNQGVFSIPEGSRVYQALELAGGFTEDAAVGFVNLARVLVDGESIYFPNKTEVKTMDFDVLTQQINQSNQNNQGHQSDNKTDNSKININSAGKESLMTLPGIGDAKAEAIIEYRTSKGYFSTIDDIMKVTGIKQSIFEKLKLKITVN